MMNKKRFTPTPKTSNTKSIFGVSLLRKRGFTPTPITKEIGVSLLRKRGFTIIETLVAISILVAIIIAATSAIQSAISSYIFSKNQIIAFYLAQEGFEQIRNMRDENSLADRDWLTGFALNPSDPCYFGEACTVDPIFSNVPIRCLSGESSCPVIKQNPVTGFYSYNSSWAETPFRRSIVLQQVNANEISVTVTVDWSKGLIQRQFKARENLFNWQR
jgi:prepilin-type N-terminal cleavage/methylation domain-containing protein